MPQGPNYGLQQGSQWVISDEGTLTIGAGGTLNVESGGAINLAAGASFAGAAGVASYTNITLGGTTGRWSFGTLALTSGLGTIGFPGFTRVMSAVAVPLLGEPPNIGSAHWVVTDLSLSGAGSVIFRVGSANGQFGANSTVTYQAFGT